MMIRKATKDDISSVVEIYSRILQSEVVGTSQTGWQKGVYPTEETARSALESGDLFVMEADGRITAAARLNQKQETAYQECEWVFTASEDQVMVLHTLVVDPEMAGKGYATEFVAFYESYARGHGCVSLRMDTNEKNLAARRLYKKLGYRESGIILCTFNGLDDVRLVCLEKSLEPYF